MRLRLLEELLRVFLSFDESSGARGSVAATLNSIHNANQLFLGWSHRVRFDLFNFAYLLLTNIRWRNSLLHSLRIVVKSLVCISTVVLRAFIIALPDWRESIDILVRFHHWVNLALYLLDASGINYHRQLLMGSLLVLREYILIVLRACWISLFKVLSGKMFSDSLIHLFLNLPSSRIRRSINLPFGQTEPILDTLRYSHESLVVFRTLEILFKPTLIDSLVRVHSSIDVILVNFQMSMERRWSHHIGLACAVRVRFLVLWHLLQELFRSFKLLKLRTWALVLSCHQKWVYNILFLRLLLLWNLVVQPLHLLLLIFKSLCLERYIPFRVLATCELTLIFLWRIMNFKFINNLSVIIKVILIINIYPRVVKHHTIRNNCSMGLLLVVKFVWESIVVFPYFGLLFPRLRLHRAMIWFWHFHGHRKHVVIKLLWPQVLVLGVEALSSNRMVHLWGVHR